MPRSFAPCAALGAVFGVCVGCSGETSSPDGADGSQGGQGSVISAAASCQDDARVDTYAANLFRSGLNGQLSFTLVSVVPAPPAKGQNTFTVEVQDAAGTPIEGDLTVDLLMPDHGHGTSVVPEITFDAATNLYTLKPVYLFMSGVWRIRLNVYDDANDPSGLVDSADFYFCIGG